MITSALTEPLRHLPLFAGLSPFQISEIARSAERVTFRPGQVIIRRDLPTDAAFVIVAGEALRVDGPEIDADGEVIAAGSLIGEMAMIVETESTSTIVARGPVRALRISRTQFLDHLGQDPGLVDHLLSRIADRLNETAAMLRAVDRTLAGQDFDASDATRH